MSEVKVKIEVKFKVKVEVKVQGLGRTAFARKNGCG
jgi:hypothetical protein